MTIIRKIVTSKIDGDSADNTATSEIRPFGETAFYLDNNNKLTLMIFDGVRNHQDSKVLSPGVLYGSNSDGGGGNSLDTIKLIPDADLYQGGNDYHIVVDAAGEGQIHLRAGGTLNSSTVDVLLGGTHNHVRVSDGNDEVVIRTSLVGEGVINRNWTFSNTGNLTLPNNSAIRVDGDNLELGNMVNFNVEASGVVNVYTNTESETPYQWQFGDDGAITLPAGGVLRETVITSNPTIELEPASADSIHQKLLIKGGAPPNYNYQNSIGISLSDIIATNNQVVTVDVYSGNLNLNDGTFYWWITEVGAVVTSSGTVVLDGFGNGTFTVEVADSSVQFRVYVGTVDGVENSDTGVSLYVNENADPSYHLHLTTGDLTDTSIFLGTDDHSVRTRSNGSIEVRTRDYDLSQSKSWLFDKDGKLTFPSGGVIEPAGMGWIGLTNGVTNNPVTIVAKDGETGEYRATVDLYRGNGDDSYVSISTYNPDITTGYQWEFRATGDLRFPDATLQRTAWTGGRVVSVPASSTGQAGDVEGDLAFNGSYMYYCTTTYSASLTFDTVITNDTVSSNVFYIAKTSVPGIPTTGWTLTITPNVPGATYNIVSAAISGSNWAITTEPANVSIATNTSVRITRPSVPSNHWKRIAWSGDTW